MAGFGHKNSNQHKKSITQEEIQFIEQGIRFQRQGDIENAEKIYQHLKSININLYSQVNGWKEVRAQDQMPCSYKEGSLFISKKSSMPWK